MRGLVLATLVAVPIAASYAQVRQYAGSACYMAGVATVEHGGMGVPPECRSGRGAAEMKRGIADASAEACRKTPWVRACGGTGVAPRR